MKRSALGGAALGIVAAVSGLALTTTSAVAASALPTLTITMTPKMSTVNGGEVSGAININTVVTGEKSDSPSVARLKPGVTLPEFAKIGSELGDNKPLDVLDPYATIVYSAAVVAQGTTSSSQAVLAPGTYVVLGDGSGHAVFTVHASAKPASLPKPAATVTAIDFAYRGAQTLRDGELVRFQNDGYLIHMFQWAQTKNVAAANKAEALLLGGNLQGAQRYETSQGAFTGPLSTGSTEQQVITEPPGVYVLFCAMTSQDGRQHFQLGMFRTIRIVK
jgi:hypothetical protein